MTVTVDEDIETAVGAFAERVAMAAIGTLELLTIELGNRLGLYEALADGPATPPELAARAGIDARYAREWLEQQATAGIVARVGLCDSNQFIGRARRNRHQFLVVIERNRFQRHRQPIAVEHGAQRRQHRRHALAAGPSWAYSNCLVASSTVRPPAPGERKKSRRTYRCLSAAVVNGSRAK